MMYNKAIAFIVGYYGEEEQLVQTAEEAAELGKAAIKLRKDRMDEGTPAKELAAARFALAEEIADILIMTDQMIYVEGLEHDVQRIMDEKIERQLERIRVAKLTAPQWLEDEYGYCRCSRCGYEHDQPETTTPYCPECGARMNGMTEASYEEGTT